MNRPSPLVLLTRAAGGAILFSLPMLMTMEMWWLGMYMDRTRLVLFLAVFFPLLVALSYISGFEDTFRPIDDVVDALVAFAIASLGSTMVLFLVGALTPEMNADEIMGKIVLQAIPGSVGALLAQSQIGTEKERRPERANKYLLELMTMAAGAVFLAFNIAPTEEVQIIAYRITPLQAIGLLLFSILVMDVFVYAASVEHQQKVPDQLPRSLGVLRYTVVGYAVAVVFSAFVLWSFGRFDGVWMGNAVQQSVVLALPASIGAAAARLIL
jgi:putative integral membrane protein (TIGR02587 family)